MKDRRVLAFGVVIGRCERQGEALRRTLVAQREACERQAEQCRLALEKYETLKGAVAVCMARIDAMTGGDEPFALDDFNEQRRYLEVLIERERAGEAAWARERDLLAERRGEVQGTRRAIANNDARERFIRERVSGIERQQENRASDLADDEAQENALARRARTQGRAA